jgi:hypothetical protein
MLSAVKREFSDKRISRKLLQRLGHIRQRRFSISRPDAPVGVAGYAVRHAFRYLVTVCDLFKRVPPSVVGRQFSVCNS